MAPRKKKNQQKSTSTVNKPTPKENTKKVNTAVKPVKASMPPKKRATAKRAATRKPPKVKKNASTNIQTNEHIENIVENILETEDKKLLLRDSENLDDSSVESGGYSSVQCDNSMESQIVESEDIKTCEITQQLENLGMQEDQAVVGEVFEINSVDNVISLDYISQEVTLRGENDSSSDSNLNLQENIKNKCSKEIQNEDNVEDMDRSMNEIEQNLSVMMNDPEEPTETNQIEIQEVNQIPESLESLKDIEISEVTKDLTEENTSELEIKTEETYDIQEDNKSEITYVEQVLNNSQVKSEIDKIDFKPELNDENEKKIEKSSKTKSKKQGETKLPKNLKKETKKKEKSKTNKQKPKLKNDEIDDNAIRRSSRIKSISVLKKPSVGHGLVKAKDCEILETKTEPEKVQLPQTTPVSNETNDKPIKVKSRWRRSSELEMNVSTVGNASNATLKIEEPVESNSDKHKTNVPTKDELVESRLKQFVHLKENSYLTERFICKEAKKMTCDCFLTEDETHRGEMACGEDCLNRLLMIECGSLCQVGDRCANKKFQKGQFAPVEVFNTHKKGLGLRAAANIPYGEFILEYIGEVLNADEFDKRAEEYSQDKNQHYYFMSLRADAIIDATQKGNISRFINHSCEPNAETQKWTVNGELRIGFFSTRTILAGEEVVFDYRFERYGKEAQKCFCEAPTCRGWLGEEPDDDEEEEEGEDEEEEEETVAVPVEKVVSKEEPAEPNVEGITPKVEITEQPVPVEVKVTPKIKKPKARRKLRKDLFEDDQLDEEIEVLLTTGLKNQAHTLKLSRLMLRAKEPAQRAKLLKVLRRGELPCRRLFLDYHGLRLMHGYMTDAQHLCLSDKKYDSLRLEVLQTLAVLPIPNKTMLQDSKVLPTVEKWSLPLSTSSPADSESNSPKVDAEITSSPTLNPPAMSDPKDTPLPEIPDESEFIRKSVGMCEVKSEHSYFKNTSGAALAEEIANIFEDDAYPIAPSPKVQKPAPVEVKPPLPNYEEEIIALASKLLEAWANLKEVFRIPKKERIEQMKEHEREANKGYIAGLGLEQYAERRNESRYRGMQSRRQQDKKNFRLDDRHQQQLLSKHNRRKLFALQVEVEQQEEERRRKQRELWRQHERNCMLIGTDPRFTAPFDPTRGFQCIWNPQIGQWQNYPLPPQNQSPMGYGSMQNVQGQVPLPNTNIPPPQMAPSPSYPYGMMPVAMPPISTSRSMSHMMSPMSAGRTPISASAPPPLPHQVTSTNVTQPMILPPLTTSMPPPPAVPQTPPPLPSGVPNLYQTTAYSPQLMMGQGQSPVIYQQEKKAEVISMIGDVKFMGPIPPPAKLPPKWKCGKDKYGRPFYYHIRVRKSQWEPPPYETPPTEEESETSSSESSSSSSDSSSDDSDSDDEIINDSRLLRQVRRQMDKELKVTTAKRTAKNVSFALENDPSPTAEVKTETVEEEAQVANVEAESSIDRRLKEQFNFLSDESPAAKRKRSSLVQEIIISPRSEEDKLQFREDLKRYKENKEMLKKQKEIILQQTKKHMKDKKQKLQQSKAKHREMKYSNSENAKKIKETFRSSMANTVVSSLNVYRKADCKQGRITNTEDFKHLARKLTHFVMLKEMKYISEIEELVCSDNVKAKARDYIRKYMGKFGEAYIKRDDEPEHYY